MASSNRAVLKPLLLLLGAAALAAAWFARPGAGDARWPDVALETLARPGETASSRTLHAEPAVVNFWASWCVACRSEHGLLTELGRAYPVHGVNHRDRREDALRWLDYYGDPFGLNLRDADGRLGAALGIEALPVTLVLDGAGRVRYEHLGPLDRDSLDEVIIPLLEELRRER